MVTHRMRSALGALLIILSLSSEAAEVAVTFDDLPLIPSSTPFLRQQKLTRELLRAIRAANVPAVGFVNENKVTTERHVRLLREWLAAGLELGNHTYSHPDLHRIDAETFEKDIVRGEKTIRELLRARGARLRWFRHPFLHTGTSTDTRTRIDRFLEQRGYRVAPVTLDNSEWIFAAAYEKARDDATRKGVGEAYILYMDRKLAYYEEQSHKLFGRNIRHVLLLHANALNAHWFDELAASMKKRGYRFVTLDRALEDPAYQSADTYMGRGGISWIHRWALTQGKKREFFSEEPATPQWVQDLAGIEE